MQIILSVRLEKAREFGPGPYQIHVPEVPEVLRLFPICFSLNKDFHKIFLHYNLYVILFLFLKSLCLGRCILENKLGKLGFNKKMGKTVFHNSWKKIIKWMHGILT